MHEPSFPISMYLTRVKGSGCPRAARLAPWGVERSPRTNSIYEGKKGDGVRRVDGLLRGRERDRKELTWSRASWI